MRTDNKWTKHLCREPRETVGFEVFTAVVMKSVIFWDMTPCSFEEDRHLELYSKVERNL
jgi:hypothetical protein